MPQQSGAAVSELAYDAPRIQTEGSNQLSASIFGSATDSRTIGGPCSDGTTRDSVQIWTDYQSISGAWSSWFWVSSSDRDCTAVSR